VVYDRPATPFVLQFLGDVNLFHGRIGHLPADGHGETCYVRPHELEIVAEAAADTWPVTLMQVLTVGPNTRLEFRRDDGPGTVDVELPREEFVALRDDLALRQGTRAHLRPRRIRRFAATAGGATPDRRGGASANSAGDAVGR
jgi:sulfate transport system ATP-binding protein